MIGGMTESLSEMVEYDLKERGIRDERILSAFSKVDRALFVGEMDRHRAYEDRALPLTHRQTISQPYMVALCLEALDLKGGEKVLEIGTGSGYQTALLAELCADLWTVERIEFLATTAEDRLLDLGYKNIHFLLADGSLGWSEGAPYDRIIVSAACPSIPEALQAQLAEGGVLVAPVGSPENQDLITARKVNGKLQLHRGTPCVFVRMIGADGYTDA